MLYGLGRKIYLERRRLLFVTTLAFLAGVIFYLRDERLIMGLPVSLVTGMIYAGVIAPTALFFCLVIPSIRFMIEAIAVSRLALSLFVFGVPEVGFAILSSPSLTALIVVAGGIVVSRLLHGTIHKRKASTWREKFRPARILRRRPARIDGHGWQHRFVGWIDDTRPVAA